jgi:hypothetical protein
MAVWIFLKLLQQLQLGSRYLLQHYENIQPLLRQFLYHTLVCLSSESNKLLALHRNAELLSTQRSRLTASRQEQWMIQVTVVDTK